MQTHFVDPEAIIWRLGMHKYELGMYPQANLLNGAQVTFWPQEMH